MKKHNVIRKIMSAGLAGILMAGTVCMPLQAKAPSVEIDEAVYVNMDYYGAVEDISVVKGCFLNGNTVIEDYGDYDEVINMSNRIAPLQEEGKITWDLSGVEDQRFYYECKSENLKNKLPWDIDVTYKLNGVEMRGEELAGAEGLVTTIIRVTPKKDIEEYYQNNMILACGTVVDMKNTLSIEAPGAQLQSLGTEKAVLFLSLPGEESEYRVDIGTNSFESMGVFFMVVPATLESLELVNDVRKVRETVEDSVDAMDKALDVILDNAADMKDDLEQVEEGLKQAEAAHQIYDDNRESMEANADAAIESLGNMITYLEVIHTQGEADKENLDETIDRLADLMYAIGGLGRFGDDMTDSLDGMNDALRDLNKISEGTITQEGIENLQQIVGMGGGGSLTVKELAENETIKAVKEATGQDVDANDINTAVGAMNQLKANNSLSSIDKAIQAVFADTNTYAGYVQAATLAKAYFTVVNKLGYSYDASGTIQGGTTTITDPSGADVGLKSLLQTYIDALESVSADAGDTGRYAVANAEGLLSAANSTLQAADSLAEKAKNMGDWTDEEIREDVMTLIDQLGDLIGMTEITLSATQAALASMRTTMELTEDTLSSSLTLTLNGLTGAVHSGVGMADGVDIMREAKDTVKDAVDSELDDLDEESNFLNMDVTESFPSFTSEKNPSPTSIQIIMRTAEISIDDEADHVTDIEVPVEDIGVWGRFKAIFIGLWESIKGLFS